MDNGSHFSTFQHEASAALIDTTKTAVSLATEDLPFHRSFDSAFRQGQGQEQGQGQGQGLDAARVMGDGRRGEGDGRRETRRG